MSAYPVLMHTALDATDCRSLAEFYRQFLGLQYRPGDEIPADGRDDDSGWLVLLDPAGHRVFAFQHVPALGRPTWPAPDVAKQMHHDFRVPSIEELQRQRQRAEELGATMLCDRSNDDGEPLYVLADPAGHPFCLLVASE
jgi:catechol-2,3-dioxygenase